MLSDCGCELGLDWSSYLGICAVSSEAASRPFSALADEQMKPCRGQGLRLAWRGLNPLVD